MIRVKRLLELMTVYSSNTGTVLKDCSQCKRGGSGKRDACKKIKVSSFL